MTSPATETFASESPMGSFHRGGTFKVVRVSLIMPRYLPVNEAKTISRAIRLGVSAVWH